MERQLLKLHEAVLYEQESGLEMRLFDGKGRGVVATRPFSKGDYVATYTGELLKLKVAKGREIMLDEDSSNFTSFMYYFKYKGNVWCIDATFESEKMGRLINHSKQLSNLKPQIVEVNGTPRIVFLASRDIASGEELLYDYGDRRKAALEFNDWLKR